MTFCRRICVHIMPTSPSHPSTAVTPFRPRVHPTRFPPSMPNAHNEAPNVIAILNSLWPPTTLCSRSPCAAWKLADAPITGLDREKTTRRTRPLVTPFPAWANPSPSRNLAKRNRPAKVNPGRSGYRAVESRRQTRHSAGGTCMSLLDCHARRVTPTRLPRLPPPPAHPRQHDTIRPHQQDKVILTLPLSSVSSSISTSLDWSSSDTDTLTSSCWRAPLALGFFLRNIFWPCRPNNGTPMTQTMR